MFVFSPDIVLRDISIHCCMAWRSSLSCTLIVEDSDSLNTMARHSTKTTKKMKGALAETEIPQVESAFKDIAVTKTQLEAEFKQAQVDRVETKAELVHCAEPVTLSAET